MRRPNAAYGGADEQAENQRSNDGGGDKSHVDVLGRELSVGDLVVDDECGPKWSGGFARVMRLTGEPANAVKVTAVDGKPTVAELNPHLSPTTPVVEIALEEWLMKASPTYRCNPHRVWDAARDPEKPNTAAEFADEFLRQNRDTVNVYQFPSKRLRRADGREGRTP